MPNLGLEFGPPTTFESAVGRLPTIYHPLWETSKEIRHLASLRSRLEDPERSVSKWSLEDRMVPLTKPDIKLMSEISFKRRESGFVIACERIEPGNIWGDLFGFTDEDYHRWEVRGMTPRLSIQDRRLVCIQTIDEIEEEFNVGIVTKEELDELYSQLTRNSDLVESQFVKGQHIPLWEGIF